MVKTIKHFLTTMKHWLSEVSKHNDKTIKVTENLEMILLNLKIINDHENISGVNVVIDELTKNIKELNDSTKNMVTNGRKELSESFNEIEKYINIKEGEDNE